MYRVAVHNRAEAALCTRVQSFPRACVVSGAQRCWSVDPRTVLGPGYAKLQVDTLRSSATVLLMLVFYISTTIFYMEHDKKES